MIKEEKEIIYKLQSKGFEIYKDNSTEKFLISKHVCNCGQGWFTNKKQCIFCGSLGYNVYTCKNNHISKLASKPSKCSNKNCNVKGEDLEIGCINPKCSSNTNQNIKELILTITKEKSKSKGIFTPKSAFSISQSICFYCGRKSSQFISSELDIFIIKDLSELKEKLKKSDKIMIINLNNKFLTICNNENYEKVKKMDNIDIEKILNYLFLQLSI